jgi:Fe-S cluster assembly iron-binding protein IscA
MISVTDRAKEKLTSILNSRVDNSQAVLRLVSTDNNRYGLHVDVENPGDTVIKHKGRKVLVLDDELALSLEHTTIDVEVTAEGVELALFQSGRNNN